MFAAGSRPRGLPIGNLTSQLWGNFYLDPLDHWLTEVERQGAYLRYTDDFLLFGDDKAGLWELRRGIVRQLAALRLKLAEPKSRLLATREGVPFCGFRFHPGLRRDPRGNQAAVRAAARALFRRRDWRGSVSASSPGEPQPGREFWRACAGPTCVGRWMPG